MTRPATAEALALAAQRGFDVSSPHEAIEAGAITAGEWADILDAHRPPNGRPARGKYAAFWAVDWGVRAKSTSAARQADGKG